MFLTYKWRRESVSQIQSNHYFQSRLYLIISVQTCLIQKINEGEGSKRLRPLNSIVAVIVVCSFFLLGGCLDTRSPERLTYIQGIGFDYEDGEFTAYVQLVNLSGLAAKREGGGSEGGLPLVVGKEKGKTLDEAIFKMYRSAIAEVYWGNLSFIIVTERLLQAQEFMSVIDMWSRFPEGRYQIYLYSTSEDLEKVLEVNPILDIAKGMGGLAFPENNYRQYSFVSLTKLRNILILLKEPNYLGYIPSVSLPDGLWKNPEIKSRKILKYKECHYMIVIKVF